MRPRRPSDYNNPLQIVEQVFAGQMLFLNDDKAHQMQHTLCRNCMVGISRSVKEYSLVEQLERDALVGLLVQRAKPFRSNFHVHTSKLPAVCIRVMGQTRS